jgi:catechol 2,3-dioxygenase-like lactoylglutathione lyase family enzyme
MIEEIYPMPSFPILAVRDLEASSKWYQEVLAFKHIFTMPEPGGEPSLVHLRWLKYADLLLARPLDGKDLPGPKGVGVTLSFQMLDRFDGNIDAFAEQAGEMGARIISGPIEQPWNVRELTILDPDGYRLVFTARLDTKLGFDEVVERAARGK